MFDAVEDGMNTVRGSSLLGYDELVQQHGLSARHLLSRSGIAGDVVGHYDRTLHYGRLAQLFQHSARDLDLPHFGLELAARQGATLLGPLQRLAQTADTVGAGLRAVLHYLPHYSPAISFELSRQGDTTVLTFDNLLAGYLESPQIVEKSLLHGSLLLSELTADACRPRAVWLRHVALSAVPMYQRYFRCPIRFSQACNALVLDPADLERPCAAADPLLHAIVRFYLDAQVLPEPGLRARIRQQMRMLLPQQRCSLQQVAKALGIGTRTLQRRLEEEGVEFEREREELRRQLAEHLLRHSHLSVTRVAHELGYRCTASFCRAHQRWFGIAPLAHRRGH